MIITSWGSFAYAYEYIECSSGSTMYNTLEIETDECESYMSQCILTQGSPNIVLDKEEPKEEWRDNH